MKLSPDQAIREAERLERAGQVKQAAALYRAILKARPDHKAARQKLAALSQPNGSAGAGPEGEARVAALFKAGQHEAAIRMGQRLLASGRNSLRLRMAVGAAQLAKGDAEAAIASFEAALARDPDYAPAHNNLGLALRAAGRLEAAIESYRAALSRNPRYPEAMNNLGIALDEAGRADEAIAQFEAALVARPGYAQAQANLGVALQKAGRAEKAVEVLGEAVRHAPGNPEIRASLGIAEREAGRFGDAIATLTAAVAMPGAPASAPLNLGLALRAAGRRTEASAAFRDGIERHPRDADLPYNLGVLLQDMGELEDAAAAFDRALDIDPDHALALSHALFLKAHFCDWKAIADWAPRLPALGIEGPPVVPFTLLSFEDAPKRHLRSAERYAAKAFAGIEPAVFAPPSRTPNKIRLGYFSADFHGHAMMHLMARLFELHDRSRFEVRAYSLRPDRGDEMRKRLVGAFDGFIDLVGMGDAEAAARARADGIDIAVDLNAYTQNSRLGIFARRAAPLQVNYLGYPGTSGAPFMDYILADGTVIPPGAETDFTEAVIRLPDAYQINDETRAVAREVPTRAECGLPEDGFVFCCFNNVYKVTASEFAIWMRLLGRVEGSVLWLLGSNATAEARLRRHAESAGIAPERLVFAGRMPPDRHLARHRQADLFLDTFNYNAHTTASDALWAGLPLLTLAGRGFPARVAASLLTTLGVPELIAETAEAYEDLALRLAGEPETLCELRDRIVAARRTSSLFDPARVTRQIEDAWEAIFARYLRGDAPTDLAL